jgi:uncharacterized membrane protein
MHFSNSGRKLTTAALTLLAIGILGAFLTERTDGLPSRILAGTTLAGLFIGMLFAATASVAYSLQLHARRCALVCCVALGVYAAVFKLENCGFLQIDVHSWPAGFLFPLLLLPVIGGIFLIAAVTKLLRGQNET